MSGLSPLVTAGLLQAYDNIETLILPRRRCDALFTMLHKYTSQDFESFISRIGQPGLKACQYKNPNYHTSCNCCGKFCFAVIKVDSLTKKRLSGASFSLTCRNGCTTSKTTNENGVAYFCIESCVPCQIFETGAPYGYQLNPRPINVFIDRYGRVCPDDCCVCVCGCGVMVPNRPIEKRFCFTVKKADSHTGDGLPGAVFDLLLNGLIISTVISRPNGNLTFGGLLPGIYHLLESVPPPGYQSSSTLYEVVVTDTGEVTIDGYPAQGFVISNMPGFRLSFHKFAMTRDE